MKSVTTLLILAQTLSFAALRPAHASSPATIAAQAPKPKLVLALVIDQFRADYLTRFRSRFLAAGSDQKPGGFQYLMTKGAYYPFADYGLLQNMTGPGHATILSGSYAYNFGIPTNAWFNAATGRGEYCVEDRTALTIGVDGAENGRSPRNFTGSTLGDELKGAGKSSRMVSIALKDRSAVLMGGFRADAAIWFEYKPWIFTTSTFYAKDGKLPEWLNALNASIAKTKSNRDALAAPLGVDLTVRAALAAMDAYKLGSGKDTDVLAVSISSHDYMGHRFGPNSNEIEEMTVFEDRAIAKLLAEVARRVPGGLANVVITLTADHGVAPAPSVSQAAGVPAGKVDERDLAKRVSAMLSERFGKREWVKMAKEFNIYLDQAALAGDEPGRAAVENAVKEMLRAEPWVQFVFSSEDVARRTLPAGMHEEQILHTYVRGRSGDVVVIAKPFFIQDDDFAAHLSGWSYDRKVPLIIAGRAFKPGTYADPARVVDWAPTLAWVLGVLPPAASEGRVLVEALK